MIQVAKLLVEVSEVKAALAEALKNSVMKEKEILKFHEVTSQSSYQSQELQDDSYSSHESAKKMRETLFDQWDELKTPVAERVDALVSLVDSAKVTPQFLTRYEYINQKLSDRVPIAQALSRKQFIEYKLKLASRLGGDGATMSSGERASLITELTEIQTSMDQAVKLYEKKYGESFTKFTVPGGATPVKSGSNTSLTPASHVRVRRL